jgi:hypothetical protein
VLTWFWNVHWFSFHMMSGSSLPICACRFSSYSSSNPGGTTFLTFMFMIHIIAGILLAIGYRTRLMTIVNFVLITSLQARNILVLHGGDVLMKLLCFWAMFLPLEKVIHRIEHDTLSYLRSSDRYYLFIYLFLSFFLFFVIGIVI